LQFALIGLSRRDLGIEIRSNVISRPASIMEMTNFTAISDNFRIDIDRREEWIGAIRFARPTMKTRPRTLFALFTPALISFAVSASAIPISNIVKNGSFETGSFPPWKTSGNTGGGARAAAVQNGGAIGIDQDSAHTGQFGVFAHPVGSRGYLQQDLHTTAGSSYDLTFWMDATQSAALSQATNANPVDFHVYWNGKLIFDLDNSAVPSSYTKFTFDDLLATGSRTNLKFGFRDDSGEFHLDDVKVVLSGVPEAFSTLWLALPLGVLLIAARKRTRLQSI
jgi:hypothetical protein